MQTGTASATIMAHMAVDVADAVMEEADAGDRQIQTLRGWRFSSPFLHFLSV